MENIINRFPKRRWILVAGTGLESGTPEVDILAAKAMGTALAKYRYGLITGGWHGVDYVVTQSFLNTLHTERLDPKDYLIHAVRGKKIHSHFEGQIIKTGYGVMEWLEPQKYADAVVLIGGRGGTYRTWIGALHDGLPRFPLGGTQGDAEKAFNETLDLWELIPVPGITRPQFERLGKKIQTEYDAELLAEYIVENMLWRSIDAVDSLYRNNLNGATTIFISYSRKDADWATRIRTLMRPAERRGLLSTWIDADIIPGKEWDCQIRERIEKSNAALLLVTNNLLESQYINAVEIPAFVEKLSRKSLFRLFWVLLEPCNMLSSIPILSPIQAIGSPTIAVSESVSKADEQCRLIEIVETITRTVQA
jgi:hypothetical protein